MNKNKKEQSRLKRHTRIKMRMRGTDKMPRLVVHRSLKNINAQVIDDAQNKVLFSLSTLDKEIRQKLKTGGNIRAAEALAEAFSRKVKEKGITKIIFDRAGYLYHGRIKAFADALRKGGMEF